LPRGIAISPATISSLSPGSSDSIAPACSTTLTRTVVWLSSIV
jgi:hypothetical protein